jgi:hypothetical protein
MGFVPINLHHYVRLHLKSNGGETASRLTAQLQAALKAYKAGVRCHCGSPIWVIGSAVAGNACFTCITGEAYPSSDYEITEACDKRSLMPELTGEGRWIDDGHQDEDVPF